MAPTTEDKIRGYFDDWEWLVTGYGWKFNLHLCSGTSDMPSSAGKSTAMITFAQFPYLKANIYVNLDVCSDDIKNSELEYYVVHELVHLLLAPLGDDVIEDSLEYSVTTIARLFLGAVTWKPAPPQKEK